MACRFDGTGVFGFRPLLAVEHAAVDEGTTVGDDTLAGLRVARIVGSTVLAEPQIHVLLMPADEHSAFVVASCTQVALASSGLK